MNAPRDPRDKKMQLFELACLLLLGGLALAGPYGLLAWNEEASLLEARQDRIAELQEEGAVLANKVDLLDPDNVDPDLASELVRRDLNVVHPDEYVYELERQP